MKRYQSFAVLIFLLLTFSTNAQNYDDVVVLINSDDETSIEVGEYFAESKTLSEEQVLRYAMTTEEILDTAMAMQIINRISFDLEQLRSSGMEINYMVTTKGCPGAVIIPGSFENLENSFEQVVSFLTVDNSAFILNPVFAPGEFDALMNGFHIVSRMESATLAGTKELIDLGNSHIVNTGRPFVVDYYNGEFPSPDTDNAIASMIDSWVAANENNLILTTENNSEIELSSQALELSGLLFFPFGSIDTLYLENVGRVDGIAMIINAFGAFDSASGTRDSPLTFLEENAHAGVGAVDFFYVSAIGRLLDFYSTYYNPNLDYNLGESFVQNYTPAMRQLVLYGDPKSTVEFSSSINPEKELIEFSLYPNPTKDFIHLEFDSKVQNFEMDIFDLRGQLIDSVNRSDLRTLRYNLNHLPTGEYAIRINTDSGNIGTRLVKI